VAVRGNERIGWFQQADSAAALRDYRFSLYVDGNRNALNDASCSQSSGPQGYECSSALPRMSAGRHVLELTTTHQATQQESGRSSSLVVVMMSQSVSAADTLAPSSAGALTACDASRPHACFRTSVIGADIAAPRRVIAVPDGTVLLLDRHELAVFDDGRASVAYSTRELESSAELVDAVVDRAFSITRYVYIAIAAEERGERMLRVARGRLVGGTIGELATIVVGLPLGRDDRAALGVSLDGELLVGVPGLAIGLAERTGAILRFTSDGTSIDRRVGVRAFAQFSGVPTTLTLDGAERLWVGTADGAQLLRVVGRQGARLVNVGEAPSDARKDLRDVAFVDNSSNEAAAAFVLSGTPRVLYRTTVSADAAALHAWSALRLVDSGSELEPVAVAIAPGGHLFVAAIGAQRERAILLQLHDAAVNSTTQDFPRRR
jgi:hypothetical protein